MMVLSIDRKSTAEKYSSSGGALRTLSSLPLRMSLGAMSSYRAVEIIVILHEALEGPYCVILKEYHIPSPNMLAQGVAPRTRKISDTETR